MTTPPEHELHSLEAVAKAGNTIASGFKEFGVREIHPHFDIPPYLVGFRGPDGRAGLLIEVVCGEVDREQGLDAVFSLAAMECVAVAATYDAHVTTVMINPRTGKPWERDEMQGLCDGEGACDTGLLTDCLTTTAVFADGEVAGFNHSYHFHEAKREVGWVDEGKGLGSDGGVLQGYIVDNMRHLMLEGRTRSALLLSETAKMFGPHLGKQLRAHRDATMIRLLSENAGFVRVARQAAGNAKERAIFKEVMADCKNVDWLD